MKRGIIITEGQLRLLRESDDSRRISYIALVLDKDSSGRLMKFAKGSVPKGGYEPRFICHHMTIAFNNGNIDPGLMEWVREHEGEEFSMTAVRLGISEKATGVQVESEVPSANRLKHVTMTTNLAAGGKPVDTNYIRDWRSIVPIQLRGRVEIIYKR